MALLAIPQDEISTTRSPKRSAGLSLIEQLAASSAGSCKNPKAPILFGMDNKRKKAIVIRSACKLWSCEPCGARKARKWIAKVVNGVNTIGGQWYFATLTARRDRRTPEQSLKDLRAGWFKLRKRIERKFGKFEYVRIIEQHKDGCYHFHLIMNAPIPTKLISATATKDEHYYCKYLKDISVACGLGFMADYQPLRSTAGAAYYVAKYLTKSIGENSQGWAKNVHRIRTSNNWTPLPDLTEENEVEWEYMQNHSHLWWTAHIAEDKGYKMYGARGEPMTANKMVKWMRKLQGYDYDKREYTHESDKHGHSASGKLARSTVEGTEGTTRQYSGQSKEHGTQPRATARDDNFKARTRHKTDENERILSNEDFTTREGTRKRFVPSGARISPIENLHAPPS